MSRETSRRYPLTLVREFFRAPRSTVYWWRNRFLAGPESELRKRGPKTDLSDEALVEEVRAVLRKSPFLGEGYRKVRARLRARGIRVGKTRTLRLMRENNLLAQVRRRRERGDRSHSGTMITELPDELWGTDANRFFTRADGSCWFFGANDVCVNDVVSWYVAKKGDRWAGLEPVREGERRTSASTSTTSTHPKRLETSTAPSSSGTTRSCFSSDGHRTAADVRQELLQRAA